MSDPFLPGERKGFDAYVLGIPREDNPYKDHRKPSGKLSWSRAWRNAWFMGWDKAWLYFEKQ